MKFRPFQLFLLFVIPLILLTACDDDDSDLENEKKSITTLIYTLTPSGGGSDRVFTFFDLDSSDGNPAIILSDTLMADTTYTGTLELYNEAKAPREDIAAVVKDEAEEHQIFYTVAGNANLTIEYADQDANGNPLGLMTDVTTGSSGSGTLTIVLRYRPDKMASGVADGNITNAGGSTDIQVRFRADIK